MLRILLVEDAPEYQTLVRKALNGKSQVDVASSLSEARGLLKTHTYDLLMLDYMLPDGTGLELCTEVNQIFSQEERPPMVMLTGKNDIEDRLLGWSAGIEDYIQKPFHPLELELRVLARARRARDRHELGQELVSDDLILNLTYHEAFQDVSGTRKKIDLTPHEFKILHYLLKNKERVLSRAQIIEFAWGSEIFITERVVDKHVSSIRLKLGAAAEQIKTVVGLGYRFNPKRAA